MGRSIVVLLVAADIARTYAVFVAGNATERMSR